MLKASSRGSSDVSVLNEVEVVKVCSDMILNYTNYPDFEIVAL